MRLEIITSLAAFRDLNGPWNDLLRGHPLDHAFMRHEWFACWLAHFSGSSALCCAVARDRDRLVAAAPMLVSRERIKGLSARVLGFAASTITPRCNVILASDCAAEAFFAFLLAIPGVDLVVARGLDREAAATAAFTGFLNQTGRAAVSEPGRLSPFITTGGAWEDYFRSLPKSFRQNLRTGANKLGRAGDVSIKKVDTYVEFKHLLPELVNVSARSWKAAEGTDLGSLPQVVAFLDDFSRLGEPAGLWELWVLFLDGRPIAFDYYLCGPQRLSLIRTDFDLAFKDLSPGHNLQQAVLQDLFARPGVWEHDMGGQAYGYKLRWTDKLRPHIDLWTAGSRRWGRVLMFGKSRFLPLIRRPSRRSESETGETA